MSCHICIVIPASQFLLFAEPCPPNNVEGKVNCENNMGTVTWEQSFGAIGYMVLLNGRDGHYLTCHSENTYCNVEGLHCGIVYYVVVVAVGETLNSTASTQLNLDTGILTLIFEILFPSLIAAQYFQPYPLYFLCAFMTNQKDYICHTHSSNLTCGLCTVRSF